MIELLNVSKSFGNKQVLKDVNLSIHDGEAVTIIGTSGCCKSTLLRILIGLTGFDSGAITISEKSMQGLTDYEFNQLRTQFGMVFQSSALFDSITVGENVGFVMSEHKLAGPLEIKERVAKCLELVGLTGLENAMPSDLSGGMRKRVSFARAICASPKILLYDEPTTGLDPVTSTAIEDLIVKLKNDLNVTTVVVTHQISTILRVSERIVMLHEGKIIEAGSPGEVMQTSDPIVRQFMSGGLER